MHMPASPHLELNQNKERLKAIQRVLWLTFFLNLIVAAAKLIYGHLTYTLSMSSDGYHSLLDASSNIVGFIAIFLASKPADQNHPYGHAKFEAIGAMIISFLLFFACWEIIHQAYNRWSLKLEPQVTSISFIIMIATMAVNLAVSRYERSQGKKLKSQFLLADAAHTQSDFFVSLSVIVSLIAIKMDFVIIDYIGAGLIVVFIGKAAFEIIRDSLNTLVDTSRIDKTKILQLAEEIDGISSCHNIRTRGSQSHVYMDLHIHVDPELSTQISHDLSHELVHKIKDTFPEVIDVVVHIEPEGHH